jgi:CelD/BcsL family acetyltransferase involved in cellulose biosynthesis
MAMAHCLDSISPLYQSLQDLPGLAARDRLARPEPHSLMRLPATLDQVYAGLSASSRADVRRKRKKMQVDFGDALKVTCIREAAEIEPALPTVEAIARKTYQRGLHVGFEDTPQMLGRLKLYAQKGWLRIYLVHIGDKPCAFWIGTVYDNIFCSDYLGFDPQFRNYSPGTFLLSEMIKDFCAAGVNAIDFGFGEGDYKGRFGNCRLMESSIYVFAPTLKGIAMNAARTTVGMTDRVLKRVMERAGLLARAKKYWRARIAKGDVSK